MVDAFDFKCGCVYMFICTTFTSVYLYILFIFLTKKKYRKFECYRIMIHIGVVQCLMAPGGFISGLQQVTSSELRPISTIVAPYMSSGVRMEAAMNFVLALNRLKVICGIQHRKAIPITLTFIWLAGIINYVFLFTPYYGHKIGPGILLPVYDYSKPYTEILQKIGAYVMIFCHCLSLTIYMIIFAYLARLHFKSTLQSGSFKEKNILFYAVSRFAVDISITVVFTFGNIQHTQANDFIVFLTHMVVMLGLPPAMYLMMIRSLRNDFFCKKHSLVIAAATPIRQSVPANLA
ncbi:hypothetical protein QR680_010049 [Steinernema hermaphroditum]|uniref:Uncharacterized protein n=1 Tax=Steinernema hermaphroditum TaxID=289476 RepID=A0AA39INX1_9BILA|nr:hypothetical protein QR680_010049 [Steinernema hermaphroditum]